MEDFKLDPEGIQKNNDCPIFPLKMTILSNRMTIYNKNGTILCSCNDGLIIKSERFDANRMTIL